MDIARLLSQFATPAVLSQIARLLGISEGMAGKALTAAVPTVLAGLLGAASKPQGADALAAAARQDTGGLEGLLRQFGQDPGAVAESGSGALSSLLGGGVASALAGKLESYAGLPAGTAGKLLGLAGAGAVGAIGQEAREKGLDAAGIARMLEGQKAAIAGAIPGDFADSLRDTGLLSALGAAPRPKPAAAAPPRPAPAPPPPQKRSGWTRWLWLLVALALLAWLLPRLFRSEPEPVVETPPPAEAPAPAPQATAPAPAPEQPAAAPAEDEAATPAPAPATTEAANPLVVGGVDIGAVVKGAMTNLTTTLGGITDAASAQAALPKLTEAQDALNGIDATVSGLPAEGKSALKQLVAGALPALQAAADKLLADSAIGPVVKPVLDGVLTKLKAYAA